MNQHEKTIIAFDELGREYIIDMFVSVRELSDRQPAGAIGNHPDFTTREGHAVTYLGGGAFSVLVPGREDAVTVRADDSDFV